MPAESPAAVMLDVSSETGPLRQVIVHTPGVEMEQVAPSSLPALLFEDILWVEHARREHETLCRVFSKVIGHPDGVLQIDRLLLDAFRDAEARERFVDTLCRLLPERNFQAFERELSQLGPEELTLFALSGVSPLPINAQPLPNLLFTRDVAAVVLDHLVLSHPATAARTRESIIMRTVVEFHPAFAGIRDRVIKLPPGVTFEGGDLLVVSPDTVMIGHSERTSFGAVTSLARLLFERTAIRRMLVVNLPKERSCMHLDTVFTFVSPGECVFFPPIMDQRGLGNVFTFTPGDGPDDLRCRLYDHVGDALEEAIGTRPLLIPCGGDDPLSQQREQWTDGANFFAIAPGVVIGYERNARTYEQMARNGYRVVTAEGFLSYHAESAFEHGEKIAIKLSGNELSRGRGGARCMTLPLARSPLA